MEKSYRCSQYIFFEIKLEQTIHQVWSNLMYGNEHETIRESCFGKVLLQIYLYLLMKIKILSNMIIANLLQILFLFIKVYQNLFTG